MIDLINSNPGLFTALAFMLALACLAAAVFFGVMLRNTEKKADLRLKQARADITDMTILFQTMRDIIGQQKTLARDFNEEIEHKMEQVKHILNRGTEMNKQLYDKQQQIVAELRDAQERVDALFRQIAHAEKAPQLADASPPDLRPGTRPLAPAPRPADPARSFPPPQPTASTPSPASPKIVPTPKPTPPQQRIEVTSKRPAIPEPETRPPQPFRPSSGPGEAEAGTPTARPAITPPAAETPPQRQPTRRLDPAVPRNTVARTGDTPLDATRTRPLGHVTPKDDPRLAATGITRSAFTAWIAEDLNGSEKPVPPKTARQAESDPADQSPANADAAREAFRALLNMPAPDRPADEPLLDVLPGENGRAHTQELPAAVEFGDNHMAASLQQRVLEYSEAGMTVAQVSRELGIGKGEVRLMLSLARQKSPQIE